MSFSGGQVYTIKDMKCEDGKWFATSTRWENLWFPLDSTDAVLPTASKPVKDTAAPLEPKRVPFKVDDIVTMAPGAFAAAAEWMPAAGELLVVCSIFHQMSTRGILVCSLTDARRLWVASVPDLMSVRAASCSHVFRAGDLVQLDGGVKGACEGKCLGTPGQGRVGRVISAGIVRNGLQRNIEVAYVDERAAGGEDGGERKGDVAVSLYSAGDLLPAPPIRYASAAMTADERQGLIECLEALSHATKTPFAPARLVDKFGLDVFSRLWTLFADTKEGYWAVIYVMYIVLCYLYIIYTYRI